MILAAASVSAGAGVHASPEYSKKEKLDCAVCHVKQGSKKLTDKGKYYEALHTLDGYDRLINKFGNCLHCHKNKPGSKKLTEAGKRVREVVKDMRGLFEWLKEGHTGPEPEPPGGDSTPPR